MQKTISRRSFLKFDVKEQERIVCIKPNFPSPEIAQLELENIENEPFIFKLPVVKDKAKKIETIPTLKKLNSSEWDMSKTAHLLRRISNTANYKDIEQFYNKGLDNTVQQLLYNAKNTKAHPPGNWVYEKVPNFSQLSSTEKSEIRSLYSDRRKILIDWWQDLILKDGISLRENMTLFWHNHFATNAQSVFFPQAIFEQNDAIRENCIGNFKTLLRRITFGPAMMIWLDLNDNKKNAPNENFARELMELFTMGVDTYTQDDVINASKAFTGYYTDGHETNYYSDYKRGDGNYWQAHHDHNLKSFMGRTGYFNGDDIIDIILEQDIVAEFICKKIYQWFIYEIPDDNFVEKMASIFRDNNYQIEPVLHFLFTSEHFYDENFFGAKIPDPTFHTLGMINKLGHKNTTFPNRYIYRSIQSMGMVLFYPPDVNGWSGYRSWINSITLPFRKMVVSQIANPSLNKSLKFETNLIEILNDLSKPQDLRQSIKDLALVFIGIPLSKALEDKLIDNVMDGASEYEWDLNADGIENRINILFQNLLKLPETQLI